MQAIEQLPTTAWAPDFADLFPPSERRGRPEELSPAAGLEQDLLDAQRTIAELEPLAELGELVAFVAHELRNPLAGIAATAEVLRDGCPPADDRAEGLSVILDEAARLESTVRNLLDFARFRQARVRPIDIASAAERAARAIAPEAERAGVAVTVQPPDRRTPVLADPELVEHAFRNLALNAIQAAPPGGTLTLRTLDPDVGSAFVCVEFADTGCGIAPHDLARIFEPFFTTRVGGVGLGLATANKLVEHLGGHITVESAPGRGSCFTVCLRRAGGEGPSSSSSSSAS